MGGVVGFATVVELWGGRFEESSGSSDHVLARREMFFTQRIPANSLSNVSKP